VQRFASRQDLLDAACTVEEREEYEPHIDAGNLVFAGVDYARVLAAAEAEADLILWDGGNNDFPFLHPDLHIVLLDPLRAGHELTHHPGEAVLRTADLVIIAKTDSAPAEEIARVEASVRAILPEVPVIKATSPITLSDPAAVRGRRVLVVEDGPTLTHGGMAYGAGFVAARRAGAARIVDPRSSAAPAIAAVYAAYPHIGKVLPAVGYSPRQLAALRETINRTDAEVVVLATPCRLNDLIAIDKPVVCARYEFADAAAPGLEAHLERFLEGLARDERP
jgi:predicted GTPase